ncbi:MAG: phosphate/phosphite/phosphonate ABC transporter substrate-binding protein, partial [Cyanobacteria bacterium Co-bin13]|nr:phosphate/phosphite/phosphonate ABC transporter substrate-binding protein [Cyanobacteria bacterium Co-bin13]
MVKLRTKGWLGAFLVGLLALVVVVACTPQSSQPDADAPETVQLTQLKFGVGPYFPTPNENRKQFEPLFQQVAEQLDLP